MNIRRLQRHEIPRMWEIDRREYIANVYRLRDGALVLEKHDFKVPGWPPGRREEVTPIFYAALDRGGCAWGAFDRDVIAAGAVLDARFFGSGGDTLQLDWLHVSRDYRMHGLGTALFETAAARAKALGAARMYVSATPSQNSVDFYMRRGCRLASEVNPELFALEPEDIHLELFLG
jgi:GNAT superfamily N-acetyltransferase